MNTPDLALVRGKATGNREKVSNCITYITRYIDPSGREWNQVTHRFWGELHKSHAFLEKINKTQNDKGLQSTGWYIPQASLDTWKYSLIIRRH